MFIYPSASAIGRVCGCRYHDEPSHKYKMAAKSAIMIQYLFFFLGCALGGVS